MMNSIRAAFKTVPSANMVIDRSARVNWPSGRGVTGHAIAAKTFLLATFIFLSIASQAPVQAAPKTYYVDPENGSYWNDGSSAKPWSSIDVAIYRSWQLKPGDRILLRSGFYGSLLIKDKQDAHITIEPEEGHTPKITSLLIQNSSHWTLRGLTISPSFQKKKFSAPAIVIIRKNSHHITIQDSAIFSEDVTSTWGKNEWLTRVYDALTAFGTNITLHRNKIRNVRYGYKLGGQNYQVTDNHIDGFTGDGIQVVAEKSLFQNNVIKNCFKVDDTHNDGFQAFTRGKDNRTGTGILADSAFKNNLIVGHENPHHPLACKLQGIGLFDGFYVNWVIENNIVYTDHWHGITVMGARGLRIANNTLIDPVPGKPGPIWVAVHKHKDGRPSSDNVVINNLAQNFIFDQGVADGGNIKFADPELVFKNIKKLDFRLRPGSRPIDAGMTKELFATQSKVPLPPPPEKDFAGQPRVTGKAVDAGAHEFQPDK